MQHYLQFLEFKKDIKLEKKAFDCPMENWEFDFYMERGKKYGLEGAGIEHLREFLKEIQEKARRKR